MDSGPLGPDLHAELTLLAPRCSQVHDRQMPLMIAFQRGDAVPRRSPRPSREDVVDRGHRYAARWLRKKIADGGFPDYDTDAVVTVALGSLLAYAAQKVTFNGPPLDIDEPDSSTPGSKPGSASPAPPNTTATRNPPRPEYRAARTRPLPSHRCRSTDAVRFGSHVMGGLATTVGRTVWARRSSGVAVAVAGP